MHSLMNTEIRLMKAIQIAVVAGALAAAPLTVASANSTGLHNPNGTSAGCKNPSWINLAFGHGGATVPCMVSD